MTTTDNINLQLIGDSDYLKTAIKDKQNANMQAIDAYEASQDAEIAKAWKQVNLEPVFDKPLDDSDYWVYKDLDVGGAVTRLEDGWIHVELPIQSDMGFNIRRRSDLLPADSLYTALIEVRNVSITSGQVDLFAGQWIGDDAPQVFGVDITEERPSSLTLYSTDTSGVIYSDLQVLVDSGGDFTGIEIGNWSTTSTASLDVRISYYEGTYDGEYIPYHDSPEDVKVRLAEAEKEVGLAWRDKAGKNLLPMKCMESWDVVDEWVYPATGETDTKKKFITPEHFLDHQELFDFLSGCEKYTLLVEISGVPSGTKPYVYMGGYSRTYSRRSALTNNQYHGEDTRCALFGANTTYVDGAASTRVTLLRQTTYPTDVEFFTNIWCGEDASSNPAKTAFPEGVKLRVSVYEGDYQGDYVPYDYDQPLPMKHRVADLESTQASQDSLIAANAEGVERAWKEGVNLHPFFTASADDGEYFNDSEFTQGIYGVDALDWTPLDDGWASISFQTSDEPILSVPKGYLASGNYTLLVEMRNLSISDSNFIFWSPGILEDAQVYNPEQPPSGYTESDFTNGVLRVSLVSKSQGFDDGVDAFYVYPVGEGGTGTVELRCSLYEGDYTGNYVPYDFDEPSQVKKRLAELETSQASQDVEIARSWKDDGKNLLPMEGVGANGRYTVDDEWIVPASSTAGGYNKHVILSPYFKGADLRELADMSEKHTVLVEVSDVPSGTHPLIYIGGSNKLRDKLCVLLTSYRDANHDMQTPVALFDANTVYTNGAASARAVLDLTTHTLSGNSTWNAFNVVWCGTDNTHETAFPEGMKLRVSVYEGEYDGEFVKYDYDEPASMKHRVAELETSQATQDSLIDANADGVEQAWKQVNLEPFFDVPLSDTDYWSYEDDCTELNDTTVTVLEDGWVRLSGTQEAFFCPVVPDGYDLITPKTLVFEYRNGSSDATLSIYNGGPSSYVSQEFPQAWEKQAGISGVEYINLTPNTSGTTRDCLIEPGVMFGNNPIDIRLSLYEGEYTGEYVPYHDSPEDVKIRLAKAEDAIENMPSGGSGDIHRGNALQQWYEPSVQEGAYANMYFKSFAASVEGVTELVDGTTIEVTFTYGAGFHRINSAYTPYWLFLNVNSLGEHVIVYKHYTESGTITGSNQAHLPILWTPGTTVRFVYNSAYSLYFNGNVISTGAWICMEEATCFYCTEGGNAPGWDGIRDFYVDGDAVITPGTLLTTKMRSTAAFLAGSENRKQYIRLRTGRESSTVDMCCGDFIFDLKVNGQNISGATCFWHPSEIAVWLYTGSAFELVSSSFLNSPVYVDYTTSGNEKEPTEVNSDKALWYSSRTGVLKVRTLDNGSWVWKTVTVS